MPDITMCDGGDCPKKYSCFRFCSSPNPWRQSYSNFYKPNVDTCGYFMLILPGDDLAIHQNPAPPEGIGGTPEPSELEPVPGCAQTGLAGSGRN